MMTYPHLSQNDVVEEAVETDSDVLYEELHEKFARDKMSRGARQTSAIARHFQAIPIAQRVTLFKRKAFKNLSKCKNARSTRQTSTMARRTKAMPLAQRVRVSKLQQLLKISKDGTTHMSRQASAIASGLFALIIAQRIQ
ncbi:hypothetical protein RND71_034561 [Anisodus tanguticus]|uniref:Uncharacterized protein n=1 Tax=Anisodus tanguticus TaxID=243964 RepID=A0AAE1RCD7_9SOLA|nr:hypothetical protein RND71_034561 [Anisodus tanguticus]